MSSKTRVHKKEKGITLVSLIIVVIILLILAGVGLTIAISDNGMISKAARTKEESKQASDIENIQMAYSKCLIDYKTNSEEIPEEKFQEELDESFGVNKSYVVKLKNKYEIIVKDKKNIYTLEKTGNIIGPIKMLEIDYAGDITKNGKFDGSKEWPYKIECIEDLIMISNLSKNNTFEGKYIILTRNLDFDSAYSYNNPITVEFGDLNGNAEDGNKLIKEITTGTGFVSIGLFKGIFDGDNHWIKNLYINSNASFQGMFSAVSTEGTVKNLKISGNISTKESYCGGIAGTTRPGKNNDGKIENCHNYCDISGKSYVGGILGYNQHDFAFVNCSNYGSLNNYTNTYTGGIVANTDGLNTIISGCANYADIENGAGIAGNIKGNMFNCYNNGNTKQGLVGANQGKVYNSYSTGMSETIVHYNMYNNSHIYKVFGIENKLNKFIWNGDTNKDEYSAMLENEKLKSNECLEVLNKCNVTEYSDYWKQDTNNINNGYPILKWQ